MKAFAIIGWLSAALLLGWIVFCTPKRATTQGEVVTYKTDWWANQDSLVLKDFRAELLPGHALNLANHTALIRVTIAGDVTYPKGYWRPSVKEIHANERFIQGADAAQVSRIEFTPIVDLDEDKTYSGSTLPFEISFEHRVNTFGWGPNTVVLSAGGKEHVLVLHQRK